MKNFQVHQFHTGFATCTSEMAHDFRVGGKACLRFKYVNE